MLDYLRILLAVETESRGTPHDHTEYVEGCFRCDLSRAEVEP